MAVFSRPGARSSGPAGARHAAAPRRVTRHGGRGGRAAAPSMPGCRAGGRRAQAGARPGGGARAEGDRNAVPAAGQPYRGKRAGRARCDLAAAMSVRGHDASSPFVALGSAGCNPRWQDVLWLCRAGRRRVGRCGEERTRARPTGCRPPPVGTLGCTSRRHPISVTRPPACRLAPSRRDGSPLNGLFFRVGRRGSICPPQEIQSRPEHSVLPVIAVAPLRSRWCGPCLVALAWRLTSPVSMHVVVTVAIFSRPFRVGGGGGPRWNPFRL